MNRRSIADSLDRSLVRFTLDLLDLLRDDFALGDSRLLVLADFHAWGRSCQQLTRPGAGRHNELERI
jgi:hypothetical protein